MHVMMKATDHCNMRCKYCYVPQEQRRGKNYLSLEPLPLLFRKIFDWQQNIKSNGEVHFNWSGGEVLTLPMSWWEGMIRAQKEAYGSGDYTIKYKNSIQTNLTLLNSKNSEFLMKNAIGIGISLDGPRECMDKTRVLPNNRSVFDRIMNNLKYLKETYSLRPGVIVVLTKHNVGHLKEVFSFFNDLQMGFQINPYHYAPSSVVADKENALTPKEYLESMCYLFDLWSKQPNSVEITNFRRITDFLLYGKNELCRERPTCVDHFYMIRWNGDVYPCNEFSGANFERGYCYGNLIEQDWREIRDHPTRQLLLKRDVMLQNVGECKDCRYWKGCHGGCFYCAMKGLSRNSKDCSPQKAVVTRDNEHCMITRGLYEYIENKIRAQANVNFLPVLLFADTVSLNKKERRISFYNFHRKKWRASMIDARILPQLRPSYLKRLHAQLIRKNNILHVCCGSSELLDYIETKNNQAVLSGVDYRFSDSDMTTVSSTRKKTVKCDDLLKWDVWKSARKYDAILIDPYFIYAEDLPELLMFCKSHLQEDGFIVLYSLYSYLQEKNILDVTQYHGISEHDQDIIPINSGGISISLLFKKNRKYKSLCNEKIGTDVN